MESKKIINCNCHCVYCEKNLSSKHNGAPNLLRHYEACLLKKLYEQISINSLNNNMSHKCEYCSKFVDMIGIKIDFDHTHVKEKIFKHFDEKKDLKDYIVDKKCYFCGKHIKSNEIIHINSCKVFNHKFIQEIFKN